MKAFVHAAGKEPHPGTYRGPQPQPYDLSDEITETDLQRAREELFEEEDGR
jgi:hypothetical protein